MVLLIHSGETSEILGNTFKEQNGNLSSVSAARTSESTATGWPVFWVELLSLGVFIGEGCYGYLVLQHNSKGF